MLDLNSFTADDSVKLKWRSAAHCKERSDTYKMLRSLCFLLLLLCCAEFSHPHFCWNKSPEEQWLNAFSVLGDDCWLRSGCKYLLTTFILQSTMETATVSWVSIFSPLDNGAKWRHSFICQLLIKGPLTAETSSFPSYKDNTQSNKTFTPLSFLTLTALHSASRDKLTAAHSESLYLTPGFIDSMARFRIQDLYIAGGG